MIQKTGIRLYSFLLVLSERQSSIRAETVFTRKSFIRDTSFCMGLEGGERPRLEKVINALNTHNTMFGGSQIQMFSVFLTPCELTGLDQMEY